MNKLSAEKIKGAFTKTKIFHYYKLKKHHISNLWIYEANGIINLDMINGDASTL